MRLISLCLMLACGISAAPLTPSAAQAPADTTTKGRKPPSKLAKIARKVADTAATTAAGAGVQSLLGKKTAGGVANALGAGGVTPCGTAAGATAGAALVGAAKGIVKQAVDTGKAAAPAPCSPGAAIPGIPGMPSGAEAQAAAAAAAQAQAAAAAAKAGGGAGASPLGGMGAVASMTPLGMAAGAAPGAIKGLKGMLGGKPQDKIAMLRDLGGKGKLELKQVKFIEGTQELEPGFEASIAAFAEAIGLTEGTWLMYVAPEMPREKGAAPDTALSRKRVAKVWSLMAASGVSDQKVVAVSELPAPFNAGRKLPDAGDARIEIIKFTKQP